MGILNTDMSKHAEQQKLLADLIDAVTNSGIDLDHLDHEELDDEELKQMKLEHEQNGSISRRVSIISLSNIPPNSIYADPIKFARVVIPLMVHTADLSNPSKDIKLYGSWAKRVVQEFFNQAENEKKLSLPVTPFMDKDKNDLPTIQVGFVNHVIRPWFDLWGRLLRDKNQGPLFQININDNLAFMQNELEKLKKQKNEMEKSKKEKEQKKDMKRRFNNNNNEEKNGKDDEELSVVDMTFEDINKVEMEERMQRMEELKYQQQQQIKYSQAQSQKNLMNGLDDNSYKNGDVNHEVIRPIIDYEDDLEQPPIPRKKKLLYTNSKDTMSMNGGSKRKMKNRKPKVKKSRSRKNSRELKSIPEN